MLGWELMRIKLSESEINFSAEEREIKFLQKAVEVLPLKKMGLEQYGNVMSYVCKRGTLGSVVIQPERDILHSIWIPEGAKNVHSTEDYQGFKYAGVDYFIYRRPRHHIKKVYVY